MSLLSSLSPNATAPAAGGEGAREVDLNNFVAEVIETSKERIVIVSFWSERSPQSKQFIPVLEKVAGASKGVARVVKCDVDKNPEIAMQLHIQSVPSIFAFFHGQPTDGFVGVLPEAQVKIWLDRLIKATGAQGEETVGFDIAFEQAAEFLAAGDAPTAQSIYADILDQDPSNAKAYAGLLHCLIALGDVDRAKQMLTQAPADIAKDKEIEPIRAQLELAEQSGKTGPRKELEEKLAQNPADHQTRFDLALALYASNEKEQAADQLLELVRRDRNWNDSAARKQLVKFFEAFGNADPVTISARKRLSSILFS
jgi:putative thioredoxin